MTTPCQPPKAPPETSYPTMSDLLANDFRGTDPKTDPDGGSTSFNALAFSTLLSSQETDAHHCDTRVSRPGLISLFCFVHRRGDLIKLPEMIFPVKSAVPSKSGRSSLYALLGSHYLLASPSGACQAYRPVGVLRPAPAGSCLRAQVSRVLVVERGQQQAAEQEAGRVEPDHGVQVGREHGAEVARAAPRVDGVVGVEPADDLRAHPGRDVRDDQDEQHRRRRPGHVPHRRAGREPERP